MTASGEATRRARGLTVVGASAGSGKTHRLTQEVLDALTTGGVPLPGLVAVTYTKRAQVELASRIRRTLLQGSQPERAALLPLANVGTVHAACLRLVRELALDAGVSPSVDVLPDADRLLRTVLEDELPPSMQRELLLLATRMGVLRDALQNRVDWVTPVVDVVTLARHGRIASTALAEMATRSAARLGALLPPVTDDDLDAQLGAALDVGLADIAAAGCTTKATEATRTRLEEARRELTRRALGWPSWCALGKLTPGKRARAAVEPVASVALRVLEHPDLQADLTRFIHLVFEAAERTMDAYARAKRERNVVDYVDMIDAALTLLEDADVARDLRERLHLVVVDELQDSSPIQLALFLRLHDLAGSSRWVGDPKQCIFEYAGADPALMDAALRWVADSGGQTDRLETNWRTRADLVDFCNGVFGAAFRTIQVAPEDVRVRSARPLHADLEALPPLGVWSLATRNKTDDATAIAEGIRRLLAEPRKTRIVDRHTDQLRNVRAGDVAVLVATNAEAEALAAALAVHRIGVAVARPGLLSTPEGVALASALALLVDPRAGLERAVLDALHGFGDESAGAWLSRRVVREAERRAAREAGTPWEPPPEREPPFVAHLARVRERGELLSPAETVDAVFAALDLASLCARWPDAAQRLANLDALRALAAEYEARCVEVAEGASIAGLLRFFGDVAAPAHLRGEVRASDAQSEAHGDHAVTVLTYHRSKGLEWPVVVLASLDREGRRDAFDVTPERDEVALDPDDPLRGRWIRYWPWPFAKPAKHALADLAAQSLEGTRIEAREHRERVRLLYVGFTRARDHLVLATRPGRTAWLDELQLGSGRPVIDVPEEPARKLVYLDDDGAEARVRIRFWRLEPTPPSRGAEEEVTWFDRIERPPSDGVAYRVSPSEATSSALELPALTVGKATRIHAPLVFVAASDRAWSEIGDAIHAFLASEQGDDGRGGGETPSERRARAARILEPLGAGIPASIDAVLRGSDALRTWVSARFPGATWRREVPVRAKIDGRAGEREIVGAIDLLLELEDDRVVLVDHKSDRVDRAEAWKVRAAVHAPQLAAYALALEAAGRRVVGCFVHFVVGGGIVELASTRP